LGIAKNVRRAGKVLLTEINKDTIPRNYLNLTESAAGRDIPAGIFRVIKRH